VESRDDRISSAQMTGDVGCRLSESRLMNLTSKSCHESSVLISSMVVLRCESDPVSWQRCSSAIVSGSACEGHFRDRFGHAASPVSSHVRMFLGFGQWSWRAGRIQSYDMEAEDVETRGCRIFRKKF
jgi:hypothetical protein